MLGDIVKVTPSSKAVGDMAIFMIQNELNKDNIYDKAKDMDFPDSIVSYFEGMMGQPEGGFPEKLKELVLKGKKSITVRPGELLEPENFDKIKEDLNKKYNTDTTIEDVLSYALYPKVYEDYVKYVKNEGDFRYMGSDIFFHGLSEGETCEVQIHEGTVYVVKLVEIRSADDSGNRDVVFEVNGNRRVISINDRAVAKTSTKVSKRMADADNKNEIGANISGKIIKLLVNKGDLVSEGQPVAIIEAMKMETNIISPVAGTVKSILVKEGQQVVAGELVFELEK